MKQFLRNPISKFALVFLLSYGLLLAIGNWGGLKEGYASSMRTVSGNLFQNWFEKGYLIVEAGTDPTGKNMDTSVRFFNLKQNEEAIAKGTKVYSVTHYLSLYKLGFLVTIFFLALVISAPVHLKRKLISGMVGFLILQGFILVRVYISLYYIIVNKPKLEIVASSDFLQAFMTTLDAALVKNIVISFLVPLILWALVTFTSKDRKLFLKMFTPKGKSEEGP